LLASPSIFNATATTVIYTLSLHDALPISRRRQRVRTDPARLHPPGPRHHPRNRRDQRGRDRGPAPHPGRDARHHPPRRCPLGTPDRKSTRLNSSHVKISYAVFCLKKKNKQ